MKRILGAGLSTTIVSLLLIAAAKFWLLAPFSIPQAMILLAVFYWGAVNFRNN